MTFTIYSLRSDAVNIEITKVAYLVDFVNFMLPFFQPTNLLNYLLVLFRIINAAITPGTHPKHVRINTISMEPQP